MCIFLKFTESQNRPNEEIRVGTIGTQRYHAENNLHEL